MVEMKDGVEATRLFFCKENNLIKVAERLEEWRGSYTAYQALKDHLGQFIIPTQYAFFNVTTGEFEKFFDFNDLDDIEEVNSFRFTESCEYKLFSFMPRVKGRPLKEIINDETIDQHRLCEICENVCRLLGVNAQPWNRSL
ncbi:hypothetical protein FACS1894113_2440 [Alphaproteobacteria bacterium]|nr:hypothetical protein FACS1894113_2440 [Alphaproteobacteria bacterium]